jgi:hypothetical protein
LTTKWIDNQVRECIWEIAQSMSIINKQDASHKQWDLLIDYRVTGISDLASKWPLWKWYMSYNTNIDCQQLTTALDKITEIGLHQRKNRHEETPTKTIKLVHV